MRGYFVTGTDTGIGKTFVTTHLARRAARRNHKVFAFKPIESGCRPPLGDDQRALVEAAGGWQTHDLCGLYQLALPAAPLVAAEAEAKVIELDRIEAVFQRGCSLATFVLVEGAGGWRVPITLAIDMGGLAARLQLPVLLVARATLGTINHTLLSAEAIERDGCSLAGVVLSQLPTDDGSLLETNIAQLERHLKTVVVFKSDPAVLDRFI